jgi:hypothetical protein
MAEQYRGIGLVAREKEPITKTGSGEGLASKKPGPRGWRGPGNHQQNMPAHFGDASPALPLSARNPAFSGQGSQSSDSFPYHSD